MAQITGRATDYEATRFLDRVITRHVTDQSGTTTLADFLIASRYLADPRQLVQGKAIEHYERAFARHIGARYAYSFCHGRVGLYAVLRALGVGAGDEVLLQVPTNVVVPNAIRYTGARPVYVDCRLDTYNMDLDQARQQITPRTKVLLLQHTFGIPVELEAALDLARRYGLEVVEDCVHALGATYDGRPVGNFGRAAFFSTEGSKTISTMVGGMAVTNDPDLAARIQTYQQQCAWPPAWLAARYILKFMLYHWLTHPHLHYHARTIHKLLGQRNPLPHPVTGEEAQGIRPLDYEQRLSNAQAAIGLHQLRSLEANLAHRRAIAALYHERLTSSGVNVPTLPARTEPAFVRYPVCVRDRDFVCRVAARHATLGTWFSSILEDAAPSTCADYEPGSCPRAEALTRHLINLPTHLRVSKQDAETLASLVVDAETAARE